MIQYFTYDTVSSVMIQFLGLSEKLYHIFFSRYFYVFCCYDTEDTEDTVLW